MSGPAFSKSGTINALLFVAAYFIAAIGALWLTRGAAGIAAIWPPSGVALSGALLLRRKPRRILYVGMAIASVVANHAIGTPFLIACAFTIANLAEVLTARHLIFKWGHVKSGPADARNILKAAFAVAIAALVSATVSVILTLNPDSGFFISWSTTTFFGMCTVTPALLFIHADWQRVRTLGMARILPVVALVALVTLGAFSQSSFPLLWLPMAAAGLATYRLGLTGAALSLLLLAFIGGLHSSAGYSVSGVEGSGLTNTLFLQLYLVGVLASLLPIASLLSAHQKTLFALAAARDLAQRREAHARNIAETDALTGVHNRGKVIEEMQQEVARSLALGTPLAVLMIDVDHFKSINDRFGHAAGDAALIAIAKAGETCARPTGIFGRLGGEEFLMVLPGKTVREAGSVAQSLQEAVRAIDWAAKGMTPVTLSIGVAEHQHGQDDSQLLGIADKRMYDAKRMGRDQVRAAA